MGRGEGRDVRRGGGRSRKIASGRAQRGAHTVEHRRAKVARSEERRGCHRLRYLVAPKAILLFGTRTVSVATAATHDPMHDPDLRRRIRISAHLFYKWFISVRRRDVATPTWDQPGTQG